MALIFLFRGVYVSTENFERMMDMSAEKHSGFIYFLFSLFMLGSFWIFLQLPPIFTAAGYTAVVAVIQNICYKTFVYEDFLTSDSKRFFLALAVAVFWPIYFVLALFFFITNRSERY